MTTPITQCLSCDGPTLKSLAQAGKNWLEHHYKRVNELNVFPVPDGDTGTNMLLTMTNAYNEIAEFSSDSAAVVAKKIAHGAVMGSRGNSGTILSQIWAGFASGLGDAEAFDLPTAAAAFRLARERAYLGVQSPVEGTILTIIREMAEEAEIVAQTSTNLVEFLERIVGRGWDAVERTPQMLPILKEAGVVDSGGTGLVYILEGMLKHLQGVDVQGRRVTVTTERVVIEADLSILANEKYNYDVQFVIKGRDLNVMRIKEDIEAMGDSGVIVGDDTVVKVHIHVDDPSIPIGYGVKLGIIDDVVVENMQAQYEALLAQQTNEPALKKLQPGQIAVVAVASGKGLGRVLTDLGVAALIEGGQTNNPSTAEILDAARATGTDRVIILPNNKNIILAAEQAVRHSEGMQMMVVPTRTFPQGVAAMLAYNADGSLQDVAEAMTEAKNDVVTGEITTAVRTVEIDGVAVQAGQIIGLINGKLHLAGSSIFEVVEGMLESLDLDDYELVTLYYGEGAEPEDAKSLADELTDMFDVEVQVLYGGQPHYPYILSVE